MRRRGRGWAFEMSEVEGHRGLGGRGDAPGVRWSRRRRCNRFQSRERRGCTAEEHKGIISKGL